MEFPALNIVFSYLFLPGPECAERCFPVYSLGWTLNYEAMFYAIFAVGLLFAARRGTALVVGVIALLAAWYVFLPSGSAMLRFWSNPIILEFLFGIGIAWLFRRGVRLPAGLGWGLIAAGFILATIAFQYRLFEVLERALIYGIPAALVVSGAILSRPREKNGSLHAFLVKGGDASYALYLSHPVAFKVVEPLMHWLGFAQNSPFLYLCLLIATATASGFLVHFFFEKPLLSTLNDRSRGRERKDDRERRIALDLESRGKQSEGVAKAS